MPAALGVQNAISRNDLKMFPKEVSDVVMELVNKHDVRYKMPDGLHLWLLASDTDVRPYKLAAKRPAQPTMLYLARWILQNVPGFYNQKTEQQIRDLTPEIEEAEQAEMDSGKVNGHEVLAKDAPGQPLIYSTGRTSVCFVWNANDEHKYLQCTMCSYSQEAARGAHLHEAKHTGAAAVSAGKAGRAAGEKRTAAAEKRQQERDDAVVAVELLAGFFGIDIGAARDVVDELTAKLAAVTQERDDLATKLAMLKEVMGV